MPSDQGPSDPRRPGRDDAQAGDWDADDGLGPVHEQRPASDYYDDDPFDDYDDGPRLLARRLVQGGVALLAVVLFLGVVWYAYTWGSRSAATGDVPVVAAPDGDEKVEPEDPGGMDVPHQDKLVLNQDGEGDSGQVERLLPPPEEPRPPERSGAAASDGASSDRAASEDRAAADDASSDAAASDRTSPEGGTGSGGSASADAAPAGDPATGGGGGGEQVADLPETTVPDQDMPESQADGDSAATAAGEDTGAAQPAEAEAVAEEQGGDTEQTGESVPSEAASAPTPGRKPGGDGAGAATQTAAADPARSPSDAGEPSAPESTAGAPADGRFAAQLAAFTSEQAARRAWSTYQQRFPDILSGQRLLLQNAEVNGQTYWRVRTGPFAERSAVQDLCDRLKAQDQACLPVTR